MSSDDYETDLWLLEMFEGWFDPCPLGALETPFDGLECQWEDQTFVNPPYSNPLPWVTKAIKQNQAFGYRIVILLKHDSSTEWFRRLHEAGARFLMINGRLKFRQAASAPFASMLAVLPYQHLNGVQRRIDEFETA